MSSSVTVSSQAGACSSVRVDAERESGCLARVTHFGEFELDAELRELRRAGRAVALGPTPLRLLGYLVEHRDRVVGGPELRRAVWPDAVVSGAALAGALRDVRRALGDDGARQRWIRTRQRVGYQFSGSVAGGAAAAAAAARCGLYGAPRSPAPCFVGRAELLAQLGERLASERAVGLHVALEGLPGMGKSELALQLAFQLVHEGRLPGGVFWLDATRADLGPSWGGPLADQFGMPGGAPARRGAQLLRRLEAGARPVLVVLDNTASWAAAARPAPLPRGPHVRVLVTTRLRNLGGSQFAHLPLGALAAPHDRELLERLAGRAVEPGAGELLAELAGHPLALEVAGAFLGTYGGESALSYLAALRRSGEALEAQLADRVRYPGTLTQALRALAQRLAPPAREAWWLLAQLGCGPGARELVLACGLEPAALHSLEEHHLLQAESAGGWAMHRLARAFGARLLPPRERARQLLLALGAPRAKSEESGAETALRAGTQRGEPHGRESWSEGARPPAASRGG
jgi:DNA-binding winged helix-turn-helix (wHTH) protein